MTHAQTFGVLGAIVGDVAGGAYEGRGSKALEFDLFPQGARFTDDTVCTLAIADALMRLDPDSDAVTAAGVLVASLREVCGAHLDAGYGGRFYGWLRSAAPKPYGSFGNGSAMRVSPAVAFAGSEADVLEWAERTAAVTHDHPEGVKGAQATAWASFQAARGADKAAIRAGVGRLFGYDLSAGIAAVREAAVFDVTCQVSVPEAITCFLDADGYEESIRNAISLGADTDTQAAIAGSIAEAFYGGVPGELADVALGLLTPDLREIIDRWVGFVCSRPLDAADARRSRP